MKKMLLFLILCATAASLALAQAPAGAPAKQEAAKPEAAKSAAVVTAPAAAAPAAVQPAAPAVVAVDKTMTAAGKVKSVSVADAVKGTKSEIVVVNDLGQAANFLVKATTTLYDTDAKPVTLDKIMADNKVEISYAVTTEGVNEAKSVKIVK